MICLHLNIIIIIIIIIQMNTTDGYREQDLQIDDQSTKELNDFVQNLLKQMQDRFEDMSSNIVGRVDDMGTSFSLISVLRQEDR